MRLRKRVMAILLTAILLVTNTLPVVAAGDSTEPVPTVKPTATLTIETVGEGTVKCTGDGVTETGDNTYSVPSETRVLSVNTRSVVFFGVKDTSWISGSTKYPSLGVLSIT